MESWLVPLSKLPYHLSTSEIKNLCVWSFNKAIINMPHLCKAKKRMGTWERQKMLPKMSIKLKFTAEITIFYNNFWKYCVFWNVNDLRWISVNFGSKIKFFQANFPKIAFLDLEIVCNSHTFSEKCLDLEWFNLLIVVGFSKSSTLSIRFCGDLEWFAMLIFGWNSKIFHTFWKVYCKLSGFGILPLFFHRFWLDLECLNCWLWLEFQNLPHLFYIVFLKIVWIWNDLTHWFWLEFQNLPQGECGFQME